jgi:cytidyltransferase-like protein
VVTGRSSDKTLALLREIYVENLRDGRAAASSAASGLLKPLSSVRATLSSAQAARLVTKNRGGAVDLTVAGRTRFRVVMMGGAFEIIHPGHIRAFTEAKALGDTLVVVVATDESVEKNKGRPPVTKQGSRVELVSSIRQVDLAIPGNKGSIYDILLKIRPDVVALGYDQRHNDDEIVQEAARRGLRISTARLGTHIPDVKTSKILLSL